VHRLAPGLLLATLAAAGLAACGGRRPVEVLEEQPESHVAGFDEDLPVPGQPGSFCKRVLTRGYPLAAGAINRHAEPFRVGPFRRTERVWITGWRSNTENEEGEREPDDIHCHALFSDTPSLQDDMQTFTGLFTDGFTPHMELPEGFGIPVPADHRMIMQPMFNNRRPEARVSRMRLELDYVPDSQAQGSMRALHAWTLRVTERDWYWVPAGRTDRRTRIVEAPFRGRVHAVGGHLHPYGEYVEIERERTHEVLFTARLRKAGHLEDQRLDTYASSTGFFVRRGEPLRVSAVYVNPTPEKVDAMAGLFLLYDPEGEPDA